MNTAAEDTSGMQQIVTQVVGGLLNRPGYGFLTSEEFVARICARLTRLSQEGLNAATDPDCEAFILASAKAEYSQALYEGWRAEDQTLRDRACAELGLYLYRIAYNYLLQKSCPQNLAAELAEDCAQQSLLQIHQYIDSVRDPQRFLGYAIRVTNGVCSRMVVKSARSGEWQKEARTDDDEAPELEPVTADAAVAFDWMDCLMKAVEALINPEWQKVLILGFFSALEDAEIAETLKTTSGNVQVMRHRALDKLRKSEALRDCLQS
jgi:RNA polymerase sigma factor (sigma-70 family)